MNRFVTAILNLDRENISSPLGMSGYGVRFERQRNFYVSLSAEDKTAYEDAVLDLCSMANVEMANLGLYICVELRDLFSPDWPKKIVVLVDRLLKSTIPPVEKNTTSYAIFRLVYEFNIISKLDYIIDYAKHVNRQFKIRIIDKYDWGLFYSFISRIMIKLSADDFWQEASSFCSDKVLLEMSGEKTLEVMYAWGSEGTFQYGSSWLKKMVEFYSSPNHPLQRWAYRSIEMSSNSILLRNPAAQDEVRLLLTFARSKLS